jgi:ribosomal protein L3 glutamine methyltransferase
LPAAYLTGEAWLHGYRFSVDSRVIVPRSLLGECLAEQLHPWIEDPTAVRTVLELCTGSGCLAVIAADAFENSKIDAVDLSLDALEVAQRNIETYGLDQRITLHAGDLYAPLSKSKRAKPPRYDLIIANPPYVNATSMRALPGEYQHEPALALAGGADGMDLVRRIIANARQWLRPDGILVIEIGNERRHAEAMFQEFAHSSGQALTPTWLTTSAGDDAVFLLRAADLPIGI